MEPRRRAISEILGQGSRAASQSSLKILVVDPHEECLSSLSVLLRGWGQQVTEAPDAEQAIIRASENQPDLVVLELDLPGMSGYELARYFSQASNRKSKRPFLIAVTSAGSLPELAQATKAGVDLHLLKPVNPNEFEMALAYFTRMSSVART